MNFCCFFFVHVPCSNYLVSLSLSNSLDFLIGLYSSALHPSYALICVIASFASSSVAKHIIASFLVLFGWNLSFQLFTSPYSFIIPLIPSSLILRLSLFVTNMLLFLLHSWIWEHLLLLWCMCSPWLLFVKYGAGLRKIRVIESSGDVTSYRMEQGLSNGTGYINCYLDCWKFTCQLRFDNTCPRSNSFQEVVNICSDN